MWQQVTNFALKLRLQQLPAPKQLIGLDMGTHFTGVAVTDNYLKRSYYLTSIKSDIHSKEFLDNLRKILLKRKPAGLIVGLPSYVKHIDEKENMGEVIKSFMSNTKHMKVLSDALPSLPYTFVDQAWSTTTAKQQLIDLQKQYRLYGHLHTQKDLLDGMSAILIMRKFLDYYHK